MSKEKSKKLGMSYSTANQRLRKMIMFDLIKKCNMDICFRCNKKIDKIEDLSIEHKSSWFLDKNPKKAFYDLNNVAFSHLSCNCAHTNFSEKKQKQIEKFILSARIDKGEDRPCSKLNNEQVLEIKKMIEENFSLRKIAKKYNVSHKQIWNIKSGKHWKHL